MDILLFEWMVGGGQLQNGHPADLDKSMFREGLAMAHSICSDLEVAGHTVHLPVDCRLPKDLRIPSRLHPIFEFSKLPQTLFQLASRSDAIIVIAPETGGRLIMALDWLEDFDQRMISPFGDIVRIGSSKTATIQLLESAGIQRPFGIQPDQPVILKPDDGAGSEGIRIFERGDEIPQFVRDQPLKWRTEQLLPGLPVSISVIGGPQGIFVFSPTQQVFGGNSNSGHSKTEIAHFLNRPGADWPGPWTGFDFPIDDPLACRAKNLCKRALNSLPEFPGYLGMDMILAESGEEDDRIVDLNPRMTTSWVGLRQLYSTNLARFMVDHALGRDCQFPVPKPTKLQFRLDSN